MTTAEPASSFQVLDFEQVARSDSEGDVYMRVANRSDEPVLVGVDVRAEPGMWLAPVLQRIHLYHLPPRAEQRISAGYRLARLTPESLLRVRVGIPEERADGGVQLPEPVGVRSFDMGRSAAASAFLTRFDSVRTPHLEVFALQGMLTAADLRRIARERNGAIEQLARMLDVEPPPRIRLVLYPDAETKTADTRHVGAGYAKAGTIVEIYNDNVRLDPYHEIAHILGGQRGMPPAWLNEGFAVYASERLGGDALGQLGSPGKTVDGRSCELAREDQLIPFDELLGFGEIGPAATRPHISYAQAASFTGYLAGRYGLDLLREAYRHLSAVEPLERNEAEFTRIFGLSTERAAAAWHDEIRHACARPQMQ